MARFASTWTNTETTDWEAGDTILWTKLRDLFQNLEFLAQLHDHSGDPGDGATLGAADDGLLFFAQPAISE